MSDYPFLHTTLLLLLYIGAWLGHVALMVFSHNWWYARPWPRLVNKTARLVHDLLILVVPVVFWLAFGFDLTTALVFLHPSSFILHPSEGFLAIYLLICWVMGFGVFPVVTLRRWLRRPPAVLASNHTRTIDVAAQLGYKPVGRGKRHLLPYLPGNEIFTVDFSERTLHLPRLPDAWDGLTILHLSDLHFCGTPDKEFFRQVMDLCADWNPDLIALTGDIVDSTWHHRWIIPLLGRLRCQVAAFAILGNHDQYYEPNLVRRRLRRLGMHVLGNGWQQIAVRGLPLVVIGHEGPWFKPEPDLSACPKGDFRLCLSHTPDNIRWAQRQDIDLMLSGHNHGGQIRLPVIGSVFVPSSYSRRYDCGLFHEPPTLLHVSRGLGEEHPIRLNCRPEVTKLVLRPA